MKSPASSILTQAYEHFEKRRENNTNKLTITEIKFRADTYPKNFKEALIKMVREYKNKSKNWFFDRLKQYSFENYLLAQIILTILKSISNTDLKTELGKEVERRLGIKFNSEQFVDIFVRSAKKNKSKFFDFILKPEYDSNLSDISDELEQAQTIEKSKKIKVESQKLSAEANRNFNSQQTINQEKINKLEKDLQNLRSQRKNLNSNFSKAKEKTSATNKVLEGLKEKEQRLHEALTNPIKLKETIGETPDLTEENLNEINRFLKRLFIPRDNVSRLFINSEGKKNRNRLRKHFNKNNFTLEAHTKDNSFLLEFNDQTKLFILRTLVEEILYATDKGASKINNNPIAKLLAQGYQGPLTLSKFKAQIRKNLIDQGGEIIKTAFSLVHKSLTSNEEEKLPFADPHPKKTYHQYYINQLRQENFSEISEKDDTLKELTQDLKQITKKIEENGASQEKEKRRLENAIMRLDTINRLLNDEKKSERNRASDLEPTPSNEEEEGAEYIFYDGPYPSFHNDSESEEELKIELEDSFETNNQLIDNFEDADEKEIEIPLAFFDLELTSGDDEKENQLSDDSESEEELKIESEDDFEPNQLVDLPVINPVRGPASEKIPTPPPAPPVSAPTGNNKHQFFQQANNELLEQIRNGAPLRDTSKASPERSADNNASSSLTDALNVIKNGTFKLHPISQSSQESENRKSPNSNSSNNSLNELLFATMQQRRQAISEEPEDGNESDWEFSSPKYPH